MRLFLGLSLPAPARAALAAAAETLKPGLPGRWLDPSDYHVTVVFLGHWADERVPELIAATAVAAGVAAPFRLGLAGIGAFPAAEDAEIVWAGVTGDLDRLRSLHAAALAAVVPLGHSPEARAYSPHVTLVRPKPRARIAPHAADLFPSFPVDDLVLFESRAGPRGPQYVPLARAALQG